MITINVIMKNYILLLSILCLTVGVSENALSQSLSGLARTVLGEEYIQPLSNKEIVREINELDQSGGASWDGFCSISGNKVSLDNRCGSCGHGSWEIGSVSYELEYESKTARITGEKYMGYDLVITCNDGSKCISISPNYSGNEGFYGDPWKELRIGVRDKEFGYELINLLKKLSNSNIPTYNISTIEFSFNAGNKVGNFFTEYDLSGSVGSSVNEFVLKAKIEYNPTNSQFDDYTVSKGIFDREIVKRTYNFENYTYQDVFCKSGVDRVKIILLGPSGDFKVNTHFLKCP